MLNFFVLGLIPGTNLQITFYWFLVAGIIADLFFAGFYLYNLSLRHRHFANVNKDVESGDQLVLFS
jgi:hypothetical protein